VQRMNIVDAEAHNLKGINLKIPHGQLIAVTGVSGSGKSSLAFDTIAAEGRRQYLESIPSFARQFTGKLIKPAVRELSGLYPVIMIGQKAPGRSSHSTVGTLSEIYDHLRLLYARFGQAPKGVQLSRSLFSFNSALGACPQCQGLGREERIDVDKLVADPNKSLRQGALVPTLPNGYTMYSQVTLEMLDKVCQAHGFSVEIPWIELTDAQRDVILNGSRQVKVLYGKHSLESRLKWSALKAKPREEGFYRGVLPVMEEILRRDRNKNILRFVSAVQCSACGGKRLNPAALSVHWHGESIDALSNIPLSDLKNFLANCQPEEPGEQRILAPVLDQLTRLDELGLGYLRLSRPAASLSQGALQRIRLVNQLSASLSHVLYVFDEPSVGLHPREYGAMFRILRELVDNGNTVIVVEHNLKLIAQADWIVELGPAAGAQGGELLYNGSVELFLKGATRTPTQIAFADQNVRHPSHRPDGEFVLKNCSAHHLKDMTVRFKTGGLNAVTGVTGSGKSSLIYQCLLPKLSRVVRVDQSPIGRTPRSNPATYTGLADVIRDLFAAQTPALERGFKKGRFSFNNKGGRCEACQGAGQIQIGMHYMGQVDVLCEVCAGRRFNEETLGVQYRGQSIANVYAMRIDEAAIFFADEPRIMRYLRVLQSLDLGYLQLGQPSTTLSGGEAQRIKLATALVKNTREATWFILEEPGTGLHHQDMHYLIEALRALAAQGHTVVYIEYQKQLIQAADWIIDLGPDSGERGGQLLYQGNLQGWLQCAASPTAQALNAALTPVVSQPIDTAQIRLYGAATHNLKTIDVEFEKNKVTVLCGLSGSGKSSLAFDTLFAESQSRFSESLSTYTRTFIKQANPAKAVRFENLTPVVAIHRKNLPLSPRSTVGTLSGLYERYRFLFSRAAALEGRPMTARAFSFNHESGACRVCAGLGVKRVADPELLVPDERLSIMTGALTHNTVIRYYGHPDSQFVALLKAAAQSNEIDLTTPFHRLTPDAKDLIFYGSGEALWETVWSFKTKSGGGEKPITGPWPGFCTLIEAEYDRRLHNKKLHVIESMMHDVPCAACGGARINAQALSVKIGGMNIYDLAALSIEETGAWFEAQMHVPRLSSIVQTIYAAVAPVLESLMALGLGHLSLTRRCSTLSGGEGQRLRLARQLSGGLTGITYILDEPTIGLHPRDVARLLGIIAQLKAKGNTVVIVEHDAEVIRAADYVIEMGPGAGEDGGRIIAQGRVSEFLQSDAAITPAYLKSTVLPKPVPRQLSPKAFGLRGVNKHNLIDRDFDFSAGGLIALTGVSGAGKSTLMHHVLLPTLQSSAAVHCQSFYQNIQFDDIVPVTQAALSGSRHATVASFCGLLEFLQSIYAASDAGKGAGLKKSAFSYAHKDGRCPHCGGRGQIKISMDFMADLWNDCDACQGGRYNPAVAKVKVGQQSIAVLLQASVKDLRSWLEAVPGRAAVTARSIVDALLALGLGHLKPGQSTASLSGGEAQRLRLAVHLHQSKDEKKLFLLDEPTSGLHYADIDALIEVFNRLVDEGHTVLFIEHNRYLIAAANEVMTL